MTPSRLEGSGGTEQASLRGTEPHRSYSPSERGLQIAHHHGDHSKKELGVGVGRDWLGSGEGHSACCGHVRAKVLITRTRGKVGRV